MRLAQKLPPKTERKKPAEIRVERVSELDYEEDPNSHLWSVSYADLLMVLLSFFIIFFSVEEVTKNRVLEVLSEGSLTFKEAHAYFSPPTEKKSLVELFNEPIKKEDSLEEQRMYFPIIEGHNIEMTKSNIDDKLFLKFPDNIFSPGSTSLNETGEHVFREIMKQILPFHEQIHLTVVGHTDHAQVVHSRSQHLTNNFDLSALRAARALQYAVALGYSPENLSAKGTAEHARNSRTLTFILESSLQGGQ